MLLYVLCLTAGATATTSLSAVPKSGGEVARLTLEAAEGVAAGIGGGDSKKPVEATGETERGGEETPASSEASAQPHLSEAGATAESKRQEGGAPEVPPLMIGGRPHLPFQLQIEYTSLDGDRCLRVITQAKPVTRDRSLAERGRWR